MHTLSASGDDVQHVLWLGDATLAAASGSQISSWSVTADAYEEVGMHATNPAGVVLRIAASPNGRYLAAALEDGSVQVRIEHGYPFCSAAIVWGTYELRRCSIHD